MIYSSRLQIWFFYGGWIQFLFLISLFTYLSLAPVPGEVFEVMWDKALHFMGWFVLTVSLALAWQTAKYFWCVALLLWSYSCFLEFMQELTGRQFSVDDMFANATGVTAAVVCCWLLRPIVERLLRDNMFKKPGSVAS